MAKILVVDDDKLTVRMIQVLLENNCHEVTTARDGQEGLEKAKTENLDLIILDVMMPEINGIRVCRTLKFDYRYKNIPIIILSIKGSDEDLKAGKDAGADAYIVKPYDAANLLATIHDLLVKTRQKENR